MIPGITASRRRSASGVRDPYWSDVIALLSFDGANGSTAMIDKTGRSWSTVGEAIVSTARSKFGAGSLRLGRYTPGETNVSVALIQRDGSAAENFGSGGFCIEGWGFLAADAPIGNSPTIISKRLNWAVSGRGWIEIWLSSTGMLEVGLAANRDGWGVRISSSVAIPRDVYWSFALDRSGSDIRLFLNGVLVASATWSAPLFSVTTDLLLIGADPGSNGSPAYFWPGYLDEIRITARSRRSENYTPDTAPFPSS